MSRDPSVSRRRLLASVGTVGALGGASGLGSWALFGDGETFSGSMAAGAVGVTIDCGSCTTDDGTVAFSLDGLSPGDRGVERFTVTATENPARVWLRTNCPAPVDPLGDAVEVRLYHDPDCEGDGETTHAYPTDGSWATLNELRTALRGGIRLDDRDGEPCLDGGVCLDLEYRLPEDATWAAALSTELDLELVAEQCRHVPEDGVSSPFPPENCPEPDCPDCVELGKLEVGDDGSLPLGVYEFDELFPPFAGDGTTYGLEVLTATNKGDGDDGETVCASFRLLAGDDWNGLAESNAPPLCEVAVKGGPITVPYDVSPPSTRTRGERCTVAQDGDSARGALPAISNVVVSVCAEDDGDDCAACPRADGSEGDRIAQATFSYAGPDGVTVSFDQQSNGNSPADDLTADGVDAGESFTVDLDGSGSTNFDVSVAESPDADGTPLSVPAQSDPSSLHTSCSDVFGVGMQLVDDGGTYTLTVESAVDKAGRQLCEVSD